MVIRNQNEILKMANAKLAPKMQEWQVEHTNLYLSSGGKEWYILRRTPPGYPEMDALSLLLTTTGRKSGGSLFSRFSTGRSEIATSLWHRRAALLIIQAGTLVANPEVEVQVGTTKIKAKARTAIGDERARLRPAALKFWPPYADYEKKTDCEIPVVVLDPVICPSGANNGHGLSDCTSAGRSAVVVAVKLRRVANADPVVGQALLLNRVIVCSRRTH